MHAITAAVLLALAVVVHVTAVLRDQELQTIDARFAVRGDQPPPSDLVIVAMDDRSLHEVGQYPFPRREHARVIDRLSRAGAKVIAYDVEFSEETDPTDDNALIEAVARARNVVLATQLVDEQGDTPVFGGVKTIRQFHARVGDAQYPDDPGGVLRRMPYDLHGLESFARAVVERATGKPTGRAGYDGRFAWIDYAGGAGHIAQIPYLDVLDGHFDRARVRGKIVLVGATTASLQDRHPTPPDRQLMAGVEINANAIATQLRGNPLRPVAGWIGLLIVFVCGAVPALLGWRLKSALALLLSIAFAALVLVVAQLLFDGGHIVPLADPLVALVLTTIGALGVNLANAGFERERIRDRFGRFVSESVVAEVVADLDADLRLGGERRIATIMFADVRGFTTWAEHREPDAVIGILNRYLTTMSDVILDAGGTVIAYMGDGIFAAFGVPVDQPDHADRALAAAQTMTGPSLAGFNDWLREQGEDIEFRIGVGLNTGPVMAGTVGSERRLEYAAIGDTTNTAARLEGLTKEHGVPLLVGDRTREALTDPDALRFVADAPVRGRSGSIKLWTP